MNSMLGTEISMDCIVVGHVSLNKKRAKKNLQKIAHGTTAKPTAAPKAATAPQYSATPPALTTLAARVATPQRAVQPVRKAAPWKQAAPTPALATPFSLLPEAVLATICSDLPSIGACAAVCKDLKASVWDNEAFWHGLSGAATRAPARESFRLAHFGLQGDWVSAFAAFARAEAPAAVLQEAVRIAGGLCASERGASADFLGVVCDALRRCAASDETWALLDTLGFKVAEREGAIFAPACLDELSAAREDLVETGILARLQAQVDDQDAFDPFDQAAPAPEEWVVDGPLPALILDPLVAEPAKRDELDDAELSTDYESESSDDEYYSVCDEDEHEWSKHAAALQDDFLDLLR